MGDGRGGGGGVSQSTHLRVLTINGNMNGTELNANFFFREKKIIVPNVSTVVVWRPLKLFTVQLNKFIRGSKFFLQGDLKNNNNNPFRHTALQRWTLSSQRQKDIQELNIASVWILVNGVSRFLVSAHDVVALVKAPVPEIHTHVSGNVKQPTNKQTS